MKTTKKITVNLKGRAKKNQDKVKELLNRGYIVHSFTANSMTLVKPTKKQIFDQKLTYVLEDAKEFASESKKAIKKIKGKTYTEDDLVDVALGVRDDVQDIHYLYDLDRDEWADNDALQICYDVAEIMLKDAKKTFDTPVLK